MTAAQRRTLYDSYLGASLQPRASDSTVGSVSWRAIHPNTIDDRAAKREESARRRFSFKGLRRLPRIGSESRARALEAEGVDLREANSDDPVETHWLAE
jgi:hypothetical protein